VHGYTSSVAMLTVCPRVGRYLCCYDFKKSMERKGLHPASMYQPYLTIERKGLLVYT